jgi:ribosome-binding protein aMBF1 (putative translation factor)
VTAAKKVADLQQARRKKRQKTGWSIAEIAKRAAEERDLFKKLGHEEPTNWAAGGDMKKILEDADKEDPDDQQT